MRVRAGWVGLAGCVLTLVLAAAQPAFAEVPVEAGRATAGQFEPSMACGCHAALVEQWSQSMHAKALSDPLYLTKVDAADKATNGVLGPFCKKCHGPAATMMSEIQSGTLSNVGKEGVTCSFCHQVIGMAPGEPGNVSQLVEPNGTRRAHLKDPQAPHATAYSQLHETSEFCGGCHNVNHPVNGMHLESTYSEWAASPYAAEGVTCQACHMSASPGQTGPTSAQACVGGPQRENVFKMTFVGANVAQGASGLPAALLKGAASMAVEASEVVRPGETVTVRVSVTNKAAGHYLPTGLTEVREMWLEVYALGEDGKKTPLGERRFGTELKDASGKAPVELWEAVGVDKDDRIAPRATVTEEYRFTMPAGAARADIVAVLDYRSAGDDLASRAKVGNPVTEMAKVTQAVSASVHDGPVTGAWSGDGSGGTTLTALYIGIGAVVVLAGIVALVLVRRRKGAGAA